MANNPIEYSSNTISVLTALKRLSFDPILFKIEWIEKLPKKSWFREVNSNWKFGSRLKNFFTAIHSTLFDLIVYLLKLFALNCTRMSLSKKFPLKFDSSFKRDRTRP